MTLHFSGASLSCQWSDQADIADRQDCKQSGDIALSNTYQKLSVIGKQLDCHPKGGQITNIIDKQKKQNRAKDAALKDTTYD